MSEPVIPYDKQLPGIQGRLPWVEPVSYLVKDETASTGWREETSGRRPSPIFLVPKIREAVDAWRSSGYQGASDVTKRLFEYWFEEDHEVQNFEVPFRYHFCQREAIDTLAWLVEIANQRDAKNLIQKYHTFYMDTLTESNLSFQTTTDGKRQVRRYIPERSDFGAQDLPPKDLRRFAFKMATGSGKTWVMAMTIVWSHLHSRLVPDSNLSTNFLIVAPNVIVYQRLEKDFANNQIFHELPLIPPELKRVFSQRVILRGESTEPDPSGNLFLTNIHQLYESRDQEWTPSNAVEALLGKPASGIATSGQRSMMERIKLLNDLVIINDEAHHVHDEDLAWSRSLLSINQALPNGVSLWLDFSATPKDQNGMFFPWTVCDYPLAQAVEDRIVKAPIIVDQDSPEKPAHEPTRVTKEDVVEKYGHWLRSATERWKEHYQSYNALNVRPVLFIMAEKNAYADAIGQALYSSPEYGFKESEVLIIHTDNTGEVRKGDVDKARQAARDIDKDTNKIKVIVSVMMLREGWDVRNVSVVLGLRPFTAKAEILPEQVIGRGLRLMPQIGPDRTQTLEVLGTPNLLRFLREQLETEGVSVTVTKKPPPLPVKITPLQEKMEYDINIPITKPDMYHNLRDLSNLDLTLLDPIFQQEDLDERYRIRLRMEFATTETEVHQANIAVESTVSVKDLLSNITQKVAKQTGLSGQFHELYPTVQDYVRERCFGRTIDLNDQNTSSHLSRSELQEAISKYLASQIGTLTVERRRIEFENLDNHLSDTPSFSWRRDLPLLEARKTIFNSVATYNPFERRFAEFLDQAEDVLRFAALGTTEQGGSGTAFRVNYLKLSGAIGFYHPDWVVVQDTEAGELNWIIETKGRIWEGTEQKDAAMRDWCRKVSAATGAPWKYIRVNQNQFRPELGTLRSLVVDIIKNEMFTERDNRETTMSLEEILEARDEGHA